MGLSPGVKAIYGYRVCCWFSPFALRGFSLGTLVFPSPQNQHFQIPNSTRNQVNEETPSRGATSKLLLIYLFYFLIKVVYDILQYWSMLCSTRGRFHLASCKECCTGVAEIKGSNSKPAWIFSGFHFTTATAASIAALIFFHLRV